MLTQLIRSITLTLIIMYCLPTMVNAQTKQSPHYIPITVALNQPINIDYASLVITQEQNLFHQYGLEVTFVSTKSPNQSNNWVNTGKADFGVDSQPNLLINIAHGLPLAASAILINQPLDGIATLKANQIHSISQLKGKRIGYHDNRLDPLFLQTQLSVNQLSLADVTLVPIKGSLASALLKHRVDAISGSIRLTTIPHLRLLGTEPVIFLPEKNGIPYYSGLMLIANRHHVNVKTLRRFNQALALGTVYLKQHPKISWKIFITRYPKFNNMIYQTVWQQTVPKFNSTPMDYPQTQCWQLANYLSQGLTLKLPKNSCDILI